jgi:hypothetical protein
LEILPDRVLMLLPNRTKQISKVPAPPGPRI